MDNLLNIICGIIIGALALYGIGATSNKGNINEKIDHALDIAANRSDAATRKRIQDFVRKVRSKTRKI